LAIAGEFSIEGAVGRSGDGEVGFILGSKEQVSPSSVIK
jgi:hypothetical protein